MNWHYKGIIIMRDREENKANGEKILKLIRADKCRVVFICHFVQYCDLPR